MYLFMYNVYMFVFVYVGICTNICIWINVETITKVIIQVGLWAGVYIWTGQIPVREIKTASWLFTIPIFLPSQDIAFIIVIQHRTYHPLKLPMASSETCPYKCEKSVPVMYVVLQSQAFYSGVTNGPRQVVVFTNDEINFSG